MIKSPEKKMSAWVIDKLPAFRSAEYVPQRFSDSTHELWRLELSQIFEGESSAFLKICQNTESPFWRIQDHLFSLDLPKEIGRFSQLYDSIHKLSSLKIPKLLKSESFLEDRAYILSSELDGSVVEAADVNVKMIQQLALHLASLHQHQSDEGGNYISPSIKPQEWPNRLKDTLLLFAKSSSLLIPDNILEQALGSCIGIDEKSFVPMMPDLRWDQFHQHQGNLYALVDLDAFVLAPRELEFVLLEYILTAEQSLDFINIYSRYHALPDITHVRPAYRLLLFLMEVLSEQNIQNWMNKEHLF
jgi:hypothetical protein